MKKPEIREFLRKQQIDNLETEIGYIENDRFQKHGANDYSIFGIGENWEDQAPTHKTLDEAVDWCYGKVLIIL